MKITIVADNREKRSGVPGLLAEKDIDVKMAQLSVGDYMINDEIVIERKTKEDFVQSILNKHLFDQCSKLRKTRMIPLIIVKGNPYNTRHSINPEAIRAAIGQPAVANTNNQVNGEIRYSASLAHGIKTKLKPSGVCTQNR